MKLQCGHGRTWRVPDLNMVRYDESSGLDHQGGFAASMVSALMHSGKRGQCADAQ